MAFEQNQNRDILIHTNLSFIHCLHKHMSIYFIIDFFCTGYSYPILQLSYAMYDGGPLGVLGDL